MIPSNYNEAVEYLFTLRTSGTKLGLDSIRFVLDKLNSPDNECDYIHVAGTNGKGSTSVMIASILQEAGLKVGLFTSPHLVDFLERVQVNSIKISQNQVLSYLSKIDSVIQNMNEPETPRKPTFFEVVTAIAALHFAKKKCDVVVLETGMGGRLDATNAIKSCASVITKIDLDHTRWLGNNISKITMEKAGIIKPDNPVFTSNIDKTSLEVISSTSIDNNCRLTCVIPVSSIKKSLQKNVDFVPFKSKHYKSGHYKLTIESLNIHDNYINLLGRHQAENAALTAVVSDWYLKKRNFKSMHAFIKKGLESVEWEGRCQVISEKPFVLLDCAHNPNGIKQLVETLKEISNDKWTVVLGILEDKNISETVDLLSEITEEIWYVKPNALRGLEFDKFCEAANIDKNTQLIIKPFHNVKEILDEFHKKKYSANQFIVTGSCYLAGDILSELKNRIRDNRTDDPLHISEP